MNPSMVNHPNQAPPPVRLVPVEDNRDWLSLLTMLLPTHSHLITVVGAFLHPPPPNCSQPGPTWPCWTSSAATAST